MSKGKPRGGWAPQNKNTAKRLEKQRARVVYDPRQHAKRVQLTPEKAKYIPQPIVKADVERKLKSFQPKPTNQRLRAALRRFM